MKVTKVAAKHLSGNFRTFKRTVRSLHVCDVDVGTLTRYGRDIYNMEIVEALPRRERTHCLETLRHAALRNTHVVCHVIGIRGLNSLVQS